MDSTESFTSKAENHSVPDYRWKRNSDGTCTDLVSAPPTGWGTPAWGAAFIPTNYSLPGRLLSTRKLVTVLVRDSRISAGELFNFACKFGPVIQARDMTNQDLASMTAVMYEDRLHAYRCFDELYIQGYDATIMIRPVGVDPEWSFKMT